MPPSPVRDTTPVSGTMTHGYKRNGTTTLLAVLNIATGQLIGKYFRRNPYEELLTLSKLMDRKTWFRDITTARIRCHSFASVGVLIEAIEAYIVHHKENPSPFVLTKTAEEISHGGPVGIGGPGAGGTDPSTSAGSSDDPVIALP